MGPSLSGWLGRPARLLLPSTVVTAPRFAFTGLPASALGGMWLLYTVRDTSAGELSSEPLFTTNWKTNWPSLSGTNHGLTVLAPLILDWVTTLVLGTESSVHL